jgi:hypothetical protein
MGDFMLILDLWGISFHHAVVVGSGNDLLFNSILGHCAGQFIFLLLSLYRQTHNNIHLVKISVNVFNAH